MILRHSQRPLFPLEVGIFLALSAAVAIYGFGAPAWVLAPIAWCGATIYSSLDILLEREAKRRGVV